MKLLYAMLAVMAMAVVNGGSGGEALWPVVYVYGGQ